MQTFQMMTHYMIWKITLVNIQSVSSEKSASIKMLMVQVYIFQNSDFPLKA